MKQIYKNLWQSKKYSSGSLNTHAYFLQHDRGNILFYNTGSKADFDQMDSLGGIRYQLLSHRDEVGESLSIIKNRFDAILGIGELERLFAETITPVDLAFSSTDKAVDFINIIHTPGHTNGSVCYYYDPPEGKSYLFTGDTFFLSHGEWSTFVLSSSGGTKESLIRSLEQLRELRPDVVLSSGFVGDVAFKETTDMEWKTAIDQTIDRLR